MPKPVPMFSVIIVNFNAGAYLQAAADSLKNQTFKNFELIIVDNDSQDGSINSLDTCGIEQVRILREHENHGFARGNNIAARIATGKWLALLNPDAAAAPDWLEVISSAIARHATCRVFASTQYSTEDETLLDGAGDAYLLYGFPWRGGFMHSTSELPAEGRCFSPCGASGVYERCLFLEHNGFDERYFCYCEDVDLGYRLQLSGEECIFLPDARITHAGSAVSGRHSEFSIYHGTRNRLWTYAKCTPKLLLVLTLPAHVALMAYVFARSPAIRRAGATWRGIRDGIKGLRNITAESPWSPPPRRVSLLELASSMAWNPFRMSQRRPHVRPLTQARPATTEPR